MDKITNKHLSLFIYLTLALISFAVFWQVHKFDFIAFDDNIYVTNNPQVNAGLTRETITWAFTTVYASFWHPLTWLSFMLDNHLFGSEPGWYHLTNLLLHIANTLLLFSVLKKMTGAFWQSAFVAALFALHPLHVESVAWVSQRKDVLSTFFWFLTMAAYLGYVKRRSIGWYLLTLLVFALGLMAKPMLVTLPFVLLLLDYWPLERFQFKGNKSQGPYRIGYLLVEKIPFLMLAVAASVIAYLAQQKGGALGKTQITKLGVPIANALVSYIRYIGKMFCPDRLAIFYPQIGSSLMTWKPIVSFMVLAVLTIGFIYLSRRRRYLAVGWFWYLGTLVPVIGIIQVGEHAWADRYSYIPLTGLFIIIAWGMPELLAKWRHRKIALGASALIVLLTLSMRTHFQLRHWQTSETLFRHAIDVTENNYVAHMSLAETFRKQGKIDQAITHTYQALQIRPKYALAHHNIGSILASQGQIDEAVVHFRRAVQVKPDYAKAHNNLAKALMFKGKYAEAIRRFRQAIRLEPNWIAPINSLAWLLATTKDPDISNPQEAIQLGKKVCELTEYKKPMLLDTLAAAYAAAGRFELAVETAEKALELAQLSQQKELTATIQNHLQLFKAGRPYIESLPKASQK